jgi:uncharacterized membrane protein
MTTRTQARPQWRVPVALLVFTAVPVIASASRLVQLTAGAGVPARFLTAPVPLAAHIAGGIGFCVLGAFQFVPALRRRPWHRLAGRVAVLCGLFVGVAGLWLTLFLPRAPGDNDLLDAFRLVFGTAMVTALVLGLVAIRRRDVVTHRVWMTRGYALGAAVGTQAVLLGLGEAVAGPPNEVTRALLMGASWVLNLVVAEWIIQRKHRRMA